MAVAIKVVGVLLIAALLIIPAAAARPLSPTPETMGILAVVIGGISACGSLISLTRRPVQLSSESPQFYLQFQPWCPH
ncbi:metal ABC transporter permease [Cohaesibacter celericrescens]|uniref:metal ABC transporter permease n=1 Tax=Cohaesibacter celericrescens TaxID=2067669 RepID=UPI001AED0AB8